MPGTRRGGNSPDRITRQRIQSFSATREELEEKNKDELAALVEEFGLEDDVPATGSSSNPLKEDYVTFLLEVVDPQTQRA